MSNTNYQAAQIEAIRADRRESLAKFQETGATAEIGVVSNIPGTYTVNTLNGSHKPNYENLAFPSKIEAVKSYARQFGSGTLKKNDKGNFLVFVG